ncbi:MAG: Xaa-Pro aminopeptidase [bacterium]|nr:Xaa-Pro aminopeptidase [bacterium]
MKPDFFELNRDKLRNKLKSGVLVLSGYHSMQLSADMAAPFEQEANFWYLTGISEPDWWVIMDMTTDSTWLVAPELSQSHLVFDGSLAPESASAISGIKKVISRREADEVLRRLAKTHSLAYTIGKMPHSDLLGFQLNSAGQDTYTMLDRIFGSVQDCRKELAALRAIKHVDEINLIKKAINLTNEVFESVKQSIDTYKFEYEIEAEFSYQFRRAGASGHAYAPIVAGGGNACTLHYGANSDKLRRPSMVLIDIGARLNGYPADITRTYSIGSPTKRQLAVHEAVQSATAEITSLLKPGLGLQDYSLMADQIMQRHLIELGLMKGESDTDAYRKYFPHAISHGLGVDVHDSLGGHKYFEPGMVLTVEPGIYIPEENLGVRIENNILITDKGHENLSRSLSTSDS